MTASQQPFKLHDLMAQGSALGRDEWLARVQGAISAGELVNELDEHDQSPLGILVQQGRANRDDAAVASLLMRAGANPLINDRAAGKALAEAFLGGHGDLASEIVAVVCNLDSTVAFRSEINENLLHVACADAPESVSDIVYHAGMFRGEIPKAWINAKDDEGKTPLHSMWSSGGVIYDRLEAGMDVDGHETAWNGVIDLIDAGANPLARDNEGVPAINRIIECVEMGFPVDSNCPHWRKIQAMATRQLMEKNTANARETPKPQSRM